MNKQEVLYGIIGLFVGVVLTMGVVGLRNNFHMGMMMEKNKMSADKSVARDMSSQDMGMSMDDMNEALEGETGDDFDKAFIEMMIEHHQGAIDMANLIEGRAKHEEIKQLGKEIISAQTKEIAEMQSWAVKWGYGMESVEGMMKH